MKKVTCDRHDCMSCVDGGCICLSEKIENCPFYMNQKTHTERARECADRISKLPTEQQLYIREKYIMQKGTQK